jgi:cytochrome c oxidase subunit II
MTTNSAGSPAAPALRPRALGAALVGVAVWALSATAAAKPQPGTGISLPVDASTEGHRIDWLMNVTNWMTGILFLIMFGWIVYASIRHGKKHEAVYDHGTSKRSLSVALAMAGSVFVFVDGNLFFNSTTDLDIFHGFDRIEKNPETIRIEVNAHQWAWDFRYAGPDGKFRTKDDIISLNDLRIPVGVPVIFNVASTDVLHAFNLPNFRAKVDAVPGVVNRFWVEAKETGEFQIVCAQHCGTNHYKMKGVITVLSKEDYALWADQASKVSARVYDENDEAAHWGWEWKTE